MSRDYLSGVGVGTYYDPHDGYYSTPHPLTDPPPPSMLRLKPLESPAQSKSPAYYEGGREYPPRRVIEDWQLGYNAGTILTYISRLGRKPPDAGQTRLEKDIDDLRKVIRHAEMEIEALTRRQAREQGAG